MPKKYINKIITLLVFLLPPVIFTHLWMKADMKNQCEKLHWHYKWDVTGGKCFMPISEIVGFSNGFYQVFDQTI